MFLMRRVRFSFSQDRITTVFIRSSADIGMIERVLSNLIENGIKFTKADGSVKVVLAQRNGTVRVEVEDTGCGIPKEDLPYVFDRFYRVDKSRSHNYAGSGLGLAIARKILELHDADLKVISIVDEGTTFSFELTALDSNHIS